MNRITFLDNVYNGKNDVWRYVLTTILTWGGAFILAMIALFFILIITYPFDNGMTVHQLASGSINSLLLLVAFGIYYIIAFFLFCFCIHFIHHKKFINLVNTGSKVNLMRILKGAALWFAILGAALTLDFMIDPASIKLSFNSAFFTLLILSLIIFPIQASFEELFFRGYLMQGFGKLSKMPVVPLLTTSIIFSLLHYWNGATPVMGIIIVIQMFIFGITLGIITLGENRLETAMGVHIAHNIFLTVIISSSDDLFTNLPSLLMSGSESSVGIPFLVLPIVLLIIIFWNKKERVFNIFKTQEIERFKPKSNLKYIETLDNAIQCFNCNETSPNGSNYCKNCGVRLKNQKSIEKNSLNNEIHCLSCYTLNPKEAVYCKQCGIKIINSKDIEYNRLKKEMQCLNCQTFNPNEAIYCKQCGIKI